MENFSHPPQKAVQKDIAQQLFSLSWPTKRHRSRRHSVSTHVVSLRDLKKYPILVSTLPLPQLPRWMTFCDLPITFFSASGSDQLISLDHGLSVSVVFTLLVLVSQVTMHPKVVSCGDLSLKRRRAASFHPRVPWSQLRTRPPPRRPPRRYLLLHSFVVFT